MALFKAQTLYTRIFLNLNLTRPSCSNIATKSYPVKKDSIGQLDSTSLPDVKPSQTVSDEHLAHGGVNLVLDVKKYDRENYLAALCIKDPKLKRAVFALRALNVQLSLVRDSTTNSDRARLRFLFWSRLVEEILRRNDNPEVNLVKQKAYYNYSALAKELLELFILIDIDEEIKVWLEDLIGSRLSSKILGYTPILTMEELELYCSKSNSSLYHLSWTFGQQLNNIFYSNYDIIPTVRKISSSLGVAQGLSNVIRGLPYNANKNCCYVPQDVLRQYNLTSKDFRGKLDGERISPAVKFMASRCQELMNEAYSDIRYIPNYYRTLFLPRVAIQANLKRLAKCNYNICDERLSRRNELLPLNIWLASKYFRAPIF